VNKKEDIDHLKVWCRMAKAELETLSRFSIMINRNNLSVSEQIKLNGSLEVVKALLRSKDA